MKKPLHYSFFSLLFLLLTATVGKAQVEDIRLLRPKIHSSDWQGLLSNANIRMQYHYERCDQVKDGLHHENVYLQLVNITPVRLKVEWDMQYWYNGKCYNADGDNPEYHKTLILEPNQLLEGICSDKPIKELCIFSKMLDFDQGTELTNFNIKNLHISPISK